MLEMAVRRWLAFALAGIALAAFLVGFMVIVAPPEPNCGEGIQLDCQHAAYDRLKLTVLGSWTGAMVLMLGATGILLYLKKNPPPDKVAKAKPIAKHVAVPTHTPDGRRVVSVHQPNAGVAPAKTPPKR